MKRTGIISLILCGLLLCSCASTENTDAVKQNTENVLAEEYVGEPYVEVNDNIPEFTEEEKECEDTFEDYSELDELGRCGQAYANISTDTMPTTARGAIGQVKPSGWHTVKYNDLIDGNYLYNRCHLIGFQLAGENANEKNLITGTRYLNVIGMLPFENEVADYVEDTENHVLYRVTPIFEGDNLVASGVQMEAWSVEDDGEGVCFNVYCYNAQPNIQIDYKTGESQRKDVEEKEQLEEYVVNMNTKKFHLSSCSSAKSMSSKNKKTYKGSREKLMQNGYQPCERCLK